MHSPDRPFARPSTNFDGTRRPKMNSPPPPRQMTFSERSIKDTESVDNMLKRLMHSSKDAKASDMKITDRMVQMTKPNYYLKNLKLYDN
jgi:hypothetical protein